MPNITIYVNDREYKAWLDLPLDQKKAIRGTLKHTIKTACNTV